MDGKALSPAEIVKRAELESREVLLAKLAGAMKAAGRRGRACSRLRRQLARLVRRLRRAGRGRVAAPRRPPRKPRPRTPRDRGRRKPRPTPTQDRRGETRHWQSHREPNHAKAPSDFTKETTMAKLSTAELIDAFKELTLLELSEFVKPFEDTFDVTAAAPVAIAAAGPAGGGAPAEAVEEQDEFDVILEAAGDKKIQVIKAVRDRHRPRPEGGQGPRRRRPQAGPGEGRQGGRREGQGGPRGRRRQGHIK